MLPRFYLFKHLMYIIYVCLSLIPGHWLDEDNPHSWLMLDVTFNLYQNKVIDAPNSKIPTVIQATN
jgi:hypothetical protein